MIFWYEILIFWFKNLIFWFKILIFRFKILIFGSKFWFFGSKFGFLVPNSRAQPNTFPQEVIKLADSARVTIVIVDGVEYLDDGIVSDVSLLKIAVVGRSVVLTFQDVVPSVFIWIMPVKNACTVNDRHIYSKMSDCWSWPLNTESARHAEECGKSINRVFAYSIWCLFLFDQRRYGSPHA